MTYRSKIRLGVIAFLFWMVVQAIRASISAEPYPAIVYPGFNNRGNKPLESRELYYQRAGEWVRIEADQTYFSFTPFNRFLRQLEESDSTNWSEVRSGLMKIEVLAEGDSVKLERFEWQPATDSFNKKSTNVVLFKL